MAKVTGALLSLEARGTVSKTLVFSTTGKREMVFIANRLKKRTYSYSEYQMSWRQYMASVMQIRQALNTTELSLLLGSAKKARLSPHHYFMREYLLLKPSDLGNTVLGLSQLGDYDFFTT